MNLKLNIFGFDIATLSLDMGERSSLPEPEVSDVIGRAVKGVSSLWIKRMMR